MKPDLVTFLSEAAQEMGQRFTVPRFIHLRYDVFNRLFPHPVFGVSQCRAEFFQETLDYVLGKPIPDHKDDYYLGVYLKWCFQNRAK